MNHQCCSKDLKDKIDFSIEKLLTNPRTPTYTPSITKIPKTPSYSPSTYKDFEPFLKSNEDPWKIKSSFNTKTILVRENYNKDIAEKHQEMSKMGKKRKISEKKDEPATKKVDKEEKEATCKKNDKRVSKLRRKLKFSKRLSPYKLRKTLQKRPTMGNVFHNNLLPYSAVIELQNRILLAEIDNINIRLRNMRLTNV